MRIDRRQIITGLAASGMAMGAAHEPPRETIPNPALYPIGKPSWPVWRAPWVDKTPVYPDGGSPVTDEDGSVNRWRPLWQDDGAFSLGVAGQRLDTPPAQGLISGDIWPNGRILVMHQARHAAPGDGKPGAEGSNSYTCWRYSDDDFPKPDGRQAMLKFAGAYIPKPVGVAPDFPPEPYPSRWSLLDPHLVRLRNGMALGLAPYVQPHGSRSVWGRLIANPEAPREEWRMGPDCYVGNGFVHRPSYLDNGVLAGVVADPQIGAPPPYTRGMIFGHYSFDFDALTFSFNPLSRIPEPDEAVPAPPKPQNSFGETSILQTGAQDLMAICRRRDGWNRIHSHDLGRSWSAPQDFTFTHLGHRVSPIPARMQMSRGPDGRVYIVMNEPHTGRGRENIALYASEPGGDGLDFPHRKLVHGERWDSYPAFGFQMTHAGDWTGWMAVFWDQGRGAWPELYPHQTPTGVLSRLHCARVFLPPLFTGKQDALVLHSWTDN